jgi:hypothetical protein
LNDPQAPTGVQLQSTPALDESFETTAVIGLVVLVCIDVGGAGLNATAITGGGGVGVVEPPPHPTQAEIETTQINGRSTRFLVVTEISLKFVRNMARRSTTGRWFDVPLQSDSMQLRRRGELSGLT